MFEQPMISDRLADSCRDKETLTCSVRFARKCGTSWSLRCVVTVRRNRWEASRASPFRWAARWVTTLDSLRRPTPPPATSPSLPETILSNFTETCTGTSMINSDSIARCGDISFYALFFWTLFRAFFQALVLAIFSRLTMYYLCICVKPFRKVHLTTFQRGEGYVEGKSWIHYCAIIFNFCSITAVVFA